MIGGESLLQRLEHHRFREAELVAIGTQVLTTLAELHGRTPAMCHGAITPANLVAAPNGKIALVGAGAGTEGAVVDLLGLALTLRHLATRTRGGLSPAFAAYLDGLDAHRFPSTTAALAALGALAAVPERQRRGRPSRQRLVAGLALGALLGGGLAYGGWQLLHRRAAPTTPASPGAAIRLPDKTFPRPPGLIAPNERR